MAEHARVPAVRRPVSAVVARAPATTPRASGSPALAPAIPAPAQAPPCACSAPCPASFSPASTLPYTLRDLSCLTSDRTSPSLPFCLLRRESPSEEVQDAEQRGGRGGLADSSERGDVADGAG